jgi:hypothetical protein
MWMAFNVLNALYANERYESVNAMTALSIYMLAHESLVALQISYYLKQVLTTLIFSKTVDWELRASRRHYRSIWSLQRKRSWRIHHTWPIPENNFDLISLTIGWFLDSVGVHHEFSMMDGIGALARADIVEEKIRSTLLLLLRARHALTTNEFRMDWMKLRGKLLTPNMNDRLVIEIHASIHDKLMKR